MITSEQHFNTIAAEYDFWKKKNWYYYENLIALYCSKIPAESSVLEIGTGTGDVLKALHPRVGKGIDVSREMIRMARNKHKDEPYLQFEREDLFDSNAFFDFDFIFLADVLEHVENLPLFLKQLSVRTTPASRLVVSVANPLWEPLLMLAEKFKMKMPEGKHKRFSIRETEKFFKEAGFSLEERGYRLLIPKKIFGADFVNKYFYRSFLRRFGFVIFWVLKKDPTL